MNETDGTKLLCHRIPISIPGEKLLEVIPGDFTIEVKVKKLPFAEFHNYQRDMFICKYAIAVPVNRSLIFLFIEIIKS